jgi:hypothetical protein
MSEHDIDQQERLLNGEEILNLKEVGSEMDALYQVLVYSGLFEGKAIPWKKVLKKIC